MKHNEFMDSFILLYALWTEEYNISKIFYLLLNFSRRFSKNRKLCSNIVILYLSIDFEKKSTLSRENISTQFSQ